MIAMQEPLSVVNLADISVQVINPPWGHHQETGTACNDAMSIAQDILNIDCSD